MSAPHSLMSRVPRAQSTGATITSEHRNRDVTTTVNGLCDRRIHKLCDQR